MCDHILQYWSEEIWNNTKDLELDPAKEIIQKSRTMKNVKLYWDVGQITQVEGNILIVSAFTQCAKCIIDLQLDFKGQKSLVHETIEAADHLCIMLPKYHCELNFIEFFSGAMKRYLWEHYTYQVFRKTFQMLWLLLMCLLSGNGSIGWSNG